MNARLPLADPLRLFADEARLRVLRLLLHERLNVTELTRVLAIAQSAVSRHLGVLREAGVVKEERRGGWTYLTLVADPPPDLAPLWPAVREYLAKAADGHGDDARLAEVLQDREERGEGEGTPPGAGEPGRSWSAWAGALGHLLPPARVVHLGCGVGALTVEVARWAGSVVGVDPDAGNLAKAREAVRRAELSHVTFSRAPLGATRLPAAGFDVALLAQVLHAVEDPTAVLKEAVRLLSAGGRVLVLDLLPHREKWVLDRLGHRRLGIAPQEAFGWLTAAGLCDIRLEETARRRGNPFTVWVASAWISPREVRDGVLSAKEIR